MFAVHTSASYSLSLLHLLHLLHFTCFSVCLALCWTIEKRGKSASLCSMNGRWCSSRRLLHLLCLCPLPLFSLPLAPSFANSLIINLFIYRFAAMFHSLWSSRMRRRCLSQRTTDAPASRKVVFRSCAKEKTAKNVRGKSHTTFGSNKSATTSKRTNIIRTFILSIRIN